MVYTVFHENYWHSWFECMEVFCIQFVLFNSLIFVLQHGNIDCCFFIEIYYFSCPLIATRAKCRQRAHKYDYNELRTTVARTFETMKIIINIVCRRYMFIYEYYLYRMYIIMFFYIYFWLYFIHYYYDYDYHRWHYFHYLHDFCWHRGTDMADEDDNDSILCNSMPHNNKV